MAFEFLLKVHDIIRNLQSLCYSSGIIHGRQSAAAAVGFLGCFLFVLLLLFRRFWNVDCWFDVDEVADSFVQLSQLHIFVLLVGVSFKDVHRVEVLIVLLLLHRRSLDLLLLLLFLRLLLACFLIVLFFDLILTLQFVLPFLQ